jgi:hypothetical protein
MKTEEITNSVFPAPSPFTLHHLVSTIVTEDCFPRHSAAFLPAGTLDEMDVYSGWLVSLA